MDTHEYVSAVMCRLPRMRGQEKKAGVRKAIERLKGWGLTVQDAAKYMLCTEEVNPGLSEETALMRMAAILDRYPDIKEGRKK